MQIFAQKQTVWIDPNFEYR